MGVYLQTPKKDKNTKKGEKQGMAFVSAEMQGWRKNMEDAAIHELDIGKGHSLFAVFDGHGGFEISQFLSKIFVRELTKLKSYQDENYQLALDEAFKNVDELILSPEGQNELRIIRFGNQKVNEHEKDFIGDGVGCTANVILVTPTHYYVSNIGDSRSVLCRGGKAIALSEDHKPESAQEEQRIKKAGGNITMGRVNGGLNLTRSFADFAYKQSKELPYDQQMITCKPDVKKFQRSTEDEFILCGCDGIWERYVDNNQGMVEKVSQHCRRETDKVKVLEDLMESLIATDTSEGIGCDNMSAILVTLSH